jgi:enoyl-CoA hydratase/carnithine racemase
VGLGLLVAASADILVASRTARLRMPEINLGIVSDPEPLRRILPEMWVRRMCLLGEAVTAFEVQLDAAGAILCDPGGTEEAAGRVLGSLVTLEATALNRTKQRLSE